MKLPVRVKLNLADWWVGVYFEPGGLIYVCPVPCVVFRFGIDDDDDRSGEVMGYRIEAPEYFGNHERRPGPKA